MKLILIGLVLLVCGCSRQTPKETASPSPAPTTPEEQLANLDQRTKDLPTYKAALDDLESNCNEPRDAIANMTIKRM